jgi:transposase
MDLLESVGENFDVNFVMRVPSRQTIHNMGNKLRTKGLLKDKKQKHKRRVLIEEKLDDIGAKLERTPRKSMKRRTQETGVQKSNVRTSTQFLKLGHYKKTVIHARFTAARSK